MFRSHGAFCFCFHPGSLNFLIENPNSDMEGELQDWEVLLSSGSAAEDHSNSLQEIDDGTKGMVTFDYFSLENNNGAYRVEAVDERSEDGSVQSGSPGWIEPRSDAPYGPKHQSELWSDSSSDRLEDQRLVDDDVSNDLGVEYSVRSGLGIVEHIKRRFHTEEYNDNISPEKDGLDSSGDMDFMNSDEGIDSVSGNDPLVGVGEGKPAPIESGGGGEEKRFVWWKLPIELLKYCVFRVNPIWSFSMAAAVVGFVMLGRRLYNLKKRTRTLQLKLLLDDKKVVNHATRLNEAISVAKRVPIIRPALPPSVGMNQWTMMSLR